MQDEETPQNEETPLEETPDPRPETPEGASGEEEAPAE